MLGFPNDYYDYYTSKRLVQPVLKNDGIVIERYQYEHTTRGRAISDDQTTLQLSIPRQTAFMFLSHISDTAGRMLERYDALTAKAARDDH